MKTSQVLTKITKRNGAQDDFDVAKITKAIQKAGEASGEFSFEVAQKLTMRVLNLAQQMAGENFPTVEQIQDIVEEVLLSSPYKETAKKYIIYRDQHKQIREITSKSSVELVDQYLKRADWKVNENSNMGFSLQGLNHYISSEISKIYWLSKIYPPSVKESHQNGDFHIHAIPVIDPIAAPKNALLPFDRLVLIKAILERGNTTFWPYCCRRWSLDSENSVILPNAIFLPAVS